VREQFCCGLITRLAPVEDGLGDVRGEVAEADDAGEIGPADSCPLGKCGKGNTVVADESSVEPARLEEQLDQPPIPRSISAWRGTGALLFEEGAGRGFPNSFCDVADCVRPPILPANFAAQEHDGRQLSAHWRQ
jgi:hypothetical protein